MHHAVFLFNAVNTKKLMGVLTVCLGAMVTIGADVAKAGNIDITALASNGWVAILPPGAVTNNNYPSADYLDNPSSHAAATLAAFNASNPGWNSSASYNASAWTPFSYTAGCGWIDCDGNNPFLARDVFNIDGTNPTGTFTTGVDDDSWVYVNGHLAFADNSHNTDGPYTFDITPYLQSGQNVIAFVADNSAGGGFGVFAANGSVRFDAAPEPLSLALAGLGLLSIVGVARRRNQRG